MYTGCMSLHLVYNVNIQISEVSYIQTWVYFVKLITVLIL